MAQRMDGEISAFEFSVIKDCFRRMVSEGLPEHEWVAAVENPLAALTGLNKADPELIAGMYPWRKAEELKRRLIDRDRLDRADRASRQILHFKREAKTILLRERRRAFQALLSAGTHTVLKSARRKRKLPH